MDLVLNYCSMYDLKINANVAKMVSRISFKEQNVY